MNTEQQPWTTPRILVASAWFAPSVVCACGQDLDVCAGSHCPRCGTSLTAHAA
jgi:hypothetical protein